MAQSMAHTRKTWVTIKSTRLHHHTSLSAREYYPHVNYNININVLLHSRPKQFVKYCVYVPSCGTYSWYEYNVRKCKNCFITSYHKDEYFGRTVLTSQFPKMARTGSTHARMALQCKDAVSSRTRSFTLCCSVMRPEISGHYYLVCVDLYQVCMGV